MICLYRRFGSVGHPVVVRLLLLASVISGSITECATLFSPTLRDRLLNFCPTDRQKRKTLAKVLSMRLD